MTQISKCIENFNSTAVISDLNVDVEFMFLFKLCEKVSKKLVLKAFISTKSS